MISKKNLKLPLTDAEKARLRAHKIKMANILDFAVDELEVLLQASPERAKEIHALAEFQTVPSVGIKFAENLVFLGYFSLDELKDKDGAKLTDEYELKKGYWTDPCVEDQFRLVVHYANTNDQKKTWWDFTPERKKFRAENGYPESRPQKAWFEILGYGGKDKKGSHSGA
ncbi:Pathogenicity locus [Algoriphagus alkaliphilus]|uniref:Pathogenicity locus n=1 Tax=Algoriphagus alkaliphilus TaxID=279824 RepID=A0A1G5XE59_9BACT|nr:helix-hairpin-helix domain-containing protein [Algoriphagus alkaliphilus]MBA4299790.1 Pathogenicity locus [Cyclobacterium sp.]SDA68738.1 Pathogenicity locus [Algoriphagus alkaliphilus]